MFPRKCWDNFLIFFTVSRFWSQNRKTCRGRKIYLWAFNPDSFCMDQSGQFFSALTFGWKLKCFLAWVASNAIYDQLKFLLASIRALSGVLVMTVTGGVLVLIKNYSYREAHSISAVHGNLIPGTQKRFSLNLRLKSPIDWWFSIFLLARWWWWLRHFVPRCNVSETDENVRCQVSLW